MKSSGQPVFFQVRSLAPLVGTPKGRALPVPAPRGGARKPGAARRFLVAFFCAGIAGCASYGPEGLSPGATQAAVAAKMGPPTERQKLDNGGERLVYARGPMGFHTWMMDFAADGRLTGWYQALEERRLAQIKPGMTKAELRTLYGPPSEQRRLAIEGRSLWFWRYPTYDCLWYVATLDAGGRVLDAGPIPDPRCDVDHD